MEATPFGLDPADHAAAHSAVVPGGAGRAGKGTRGNRNTLKYQWIPFSSASLWLGMTAEGGAASATISAATDPGLIAQRTRAGEPAIGGPSLGRRIRRRIETPRA
jgi:hypothetical protein